ncbi:penicillin-binding protein 2 [Halanaerobaculum tunisiense]
MKENQRENRRLSLFRFGIIFIFLLLLGRLYYLQIYSNQQFRELSEGYRTSVIPISAPRGKIYDQDEKLLVSNKLTYTVSVIPSELEKSEEQLTELTTILDLKLEEIKNKLKDNTTDRAVVLQRDISREELIRLEENKSQIPGLIIEKKPIREYVHDDLASHVLGYVGEISASELTSKSDQDYRIGDLIGKAGLESIYEDYLRGKKGKKLIEVNNLGQKVDTLGVENPVTGYDLVLNLDYKLQKTAEKLLAEKIKQLIAKAKDDVEVKQPPKGGAVIITDPDDGSILAMASYPEYDPNQFSTGMSPSEWQKLNDNYYQPLLNRAINTSAPSGSIFKIVTAAAGMEELDITGETEFNDPGYYKTGGVKFKNWYPGGQGEIDFVDAIAWSNNTVFYKLGHQLYKEDKTLLQQYARQFGLGSQTKVDLPNEAQGLVPDPAWRKNRFDKRENQIWYPGYTINLAIGQGNLRTSPLQLANLVSAVANGGKLYQPLIVDKIIDSEGELIKNVQPQLLSELEVAQSDLEVITKGMQGVTEYGTAEDSFENIPLAIAGKTGTAQTGGNRPNHGWFAGFAPVDEPEIAISVFIEYGGSSSNTLPIAKGMIKEYFDLEIELNEESR